MTSTPCPCLACVVKVNGYHAGREQMILCPVCGNKRCPHAYNHEKVCTWSNEPDQIGHTLRCDCKTSQACRDFMAGLMPIEALNRALYYHCNHACPDFYATWWLAQQGRRS
jgi:hypothetical protein